MITTINYAGHTTVPADHEAPDGTLALSLNLINEDGALRPILPPVTKFQTLGSDMILFIHLIGSSAVNYILAKTKSDGDIELYWLVKTDSTTTSVGATYFSTLSDILDVEAVGNTLIIATSHGLEYFLWKDSSYISLGSRPPFISIDFGLENIGILGSSEKFNIPALCAPHSGMTSPNKLPSKEDIASFTQTVYGFLNSAVAENVTSNGLFYQPFFIRYAFRLYDGSYCWHSAPILMLPTVTPPIIKIDGDGTGSTDTVEVTLSFDSYYFKLNYRILADGIESLQKWSDLISGIDIFISAPIYTYDASEDLPQHPITNIRSMLVDIWDYNNTAIYRASNATTLPESVFVGHYSNVTTHNYIDHTKSLSDTTQIVYIRQNANFHNQLRDCHLFYKVASIEFSEIKAMSAFKKLDLLDNDMTALVTKEPMTDDYKTHCDIIPAGLYAYNSRLNIYDIKIKPATPLPLRSCSQFSDPAGTSTTDVTITVWTRINGVKCKTIHTGDSSRLADIVYSPETNLPRYIFYPDSSAYKMEIAVAGGSTFVVDLIRHDFLEGAYYYNPRFSASAIPDGAEPETEECPATVTLGSKVYTSEVNNPFFFPLSDINTVGTGRILGIATAARALSQGQFGQFPLYVFTDNGVWAMEVSANGTYSARQPITRDVCINPRGITQIDSAVLFPTARGIMLISGSQTQCISDDINSPYPFDVTTLPGFSSICTAAGLTVTPAALRLAPFTDFLRGCRMLYDYVHRRIIVYNDPATFPYAYVYSLKTQTWALITSSITESLNSYPQALAVLADGSVVDFADDTPAGDNAGTNLPALLITRPLQLSAPDIHKTIDNIIQRGNFRRGHIRSVLYGSRDLFTWHLVWSSQDHILRGFRGTPYKYFRLAIPATLSPDETIRSASVSFTPRLTNQPR